MDLRIQIPSNSNPKDIKRVLGLFPSTLKLHKLKNSVDHWSPGAGPSHRMENRVDLADLADHPTRVNPIKHMSRKLAGGDPAWRPVSVPCDQANIDFHVMNTVDK